MRDGIRREPPRQSVGYSPKKPSYRNEPISEEMRRPLDIFQKKSAAKGAEGYGVERLAVGTRVVHSMFGEGRILSARDMGGDVLYEVAFESGQTKKLMATFAKLRKI